MNDDGVRQKAAEDLEAAERQIELLRAQIAEQEEHAEDVRHFLALYQAYQPATGTLNPITSLRGTTPADNLIASALSGHDR